MLSIRNNQVYSTQNIPTDNYFLVLASDQPKLFHQYYIIRHLLICFDVNEIQRVVLKEMIEHLILSGRLPSDGVDPFIGDWFVFYPLKWIPNRAFVNLEICSYIF